jgi:hydroxymethylpyrimidine/phosphomethylpyrimidine kinase
VNPPVVLTIAGSDSGGGAGIQADLKTFAAFGVFGTSAITAVTAQNTAEVRVVHALPVEVVRAQIEAVLDDLPVAAVKTGMLATTEILELVATLANAGRLPNLVVDPVMVSSTGARLLDEEAERRYGQRLLPAATVFTPNLFEAGVLVGRDIATLADQQGAARELAARTSGIVVVKGGHATTDAGDRAADAIAGRGVDDLVVRPRVDTINNHGSGCTFASAVAAGIANGVSPAVAITAAKDFVHRAIAGAARWDLGSGHGPLDHFGWENP